MEIFTILLIILLFAISLYIYLIWEFNYWIERNVVGPKPKPYLGTFPTTALQTRHITYDMDDIYKKYKGKTPYVGIFSNRTPQLLALDPELIKDVLIRNFKNFQKNQFADLIDKETDPIFGRNPFLLQGDDWKEKRSEITPAFTTNKMKAMYPIIEDVCVRMTKYIRQEQNRNATDGFDAKELASKFTIDNVSNCIYGLDSKAFIDEDSIIRKMGTTLFAPSIRFFIYLTLFQIFPFIKKIYKMPFVPKSVEHFFTNLMNDAINIRKSNNIDRDDYLGYLLQLKDRKNLANIDMAAHTVTFFIDGFETSSMVISYILYWLGNNNEVQEKLRNEINNRIAKDGSLTYENLHDMEYLDQVFNETLRLSPPGTFLGKTCTEPIKVTDYKDKKLVIEKEMTVLLPIYSIQRDPQYYTDPEKFNPERFSTENGGVKRYRDMGVFIPFGDGPRICLGMRFATLQTKAAIIEIVRNFKISINLKTKEPLIMDPKNFLNVPIGGIWLNLELIK